MLLKGIQAQLRELQASVGVVTKEREVAASASGLESAMTTAGIPEELRPQIRELTAGMALDGGTQTGLVAWVKSMHEKITGSLASQNIDVQEILASVGGGGQKLAGTALLDAQLKKYFNFDGDTGGGE